VVSSCNLSHALNKLQTYREYNVDKIHSAHNDKPDSHVVVSIRQEQERGREDVVGEHLGEVLALLLNVDYKDLLDVKGPLDQIVPLENALDLPEWPAIPDAVQVEPKLRVVHDVLFNVSFPDASAWEDISRTMPSDHDEV
jgi:hypothetical protein